MAVLVTISKISDLEANITAKFTTLKESLVKSIETTFIEQQKEEAKKPPKATVAQMKALEAKMSEYLSAQEANMTA